MAIEDIEKKAVRAVKHVKTAIGHKPTDAEAHRDSREQDESQRMGLGQRRINFIWEVTQSAIALSVVGTGLYTAAHLCIKNADTPGHEQAAITSFLLISNVVFLVIGFYFGRTNHVKVGGVEGGGSRER
jgi:hypothetical protein